MADMFDLVRPPHTPPLSYESMHVERSLRASLEAVSTDRDRLKERNAQLRALLVAILKDGEYKIPFSTLKDLDFDAYEIRTEGDSRDESVRVWLRERT